ncbi:hypothetical protein J2X52_003462 [Luteimonas sp. 3794]|nr:hypothetical protein [Luteimonas sp. 3794]
MDRRGWLRVRGALSALCHGLRLLANAARANSGASADVRGGAGQIRTLFRSAG